MDLVADHATVGHDGDDDDDPDITHNQTTTWEPHRERQFLFDRRRWGSHTGSFALGASLRSFTGNSMTSFTGPLDAAGGRLVFATNAEAENLIYGNYHGDDDDDDDGDLRMSTIIDETNHTAISEPKSDDAPACVKNSILRSSLSPSATLGVGSFSTVRLAWRREIGYAHNNNKIDLTRLSQATSSYCQAHDVESEHKGEQLVAVKIVQKSILKQIKTMEKGYDNHHLIVHTAFDNIEREIALMKRLHHPNLVCLYEVIDSVESDTLLMVLEYASLGEILSNVNGTNRYTRMRYRNRVQGLTNEGHFDERHCALYFVDIMHGLAYLHRNRICHRDIKPENILLCASGIVKIGDFGVSYRFEDELLSAIDDNNSNDNTSNNKVGNITMQNNDEENDSTTLKCESDKALEMMSCYNSGILKKTEGTWCFWSPEMCDDSSNGFSGYAADLWSAGICLYIFATGTLPFFSLDPSILFDMIAMAVVPYEGRGLSYNLIDLLGKLLKKDPSRRAGVGDCLKHTFCAQARSERINTVDCKLMSDENIGTKIKELDAINTNTNKSSARLNLANLKRERSLRNSVGLAHYSTIKKWCRENFIGKSSS